MRLTGLNRGALATGLAVALMASTASSPTSAGDGFDAHVGLDAHVEVDAGVYAEVIVQTRGDVGSAAAAVRAAGGRVTDVLAIVDGVAAHVPRGSFARLRASPGVVAVTPNAVVGTTSDDASRDPSEQAVVGAPHVLATGAGALHARGLTGAHRGSAPTRVALLDTGVDTEAADHGDLQGRVLAVEDPFAARSRGAALVPCVNLSDELTCDDGYGHGTFMAGLIAGSGQASGGAFTGTAPGADLISVKVAGSSGQTDVRRILKGLQWVVAFQDRYDIGILNLSLGAVGTRDHRLDPVNRAVQRVWDAGIVVVASAGNGGVPADGVTSTITKPGSSPLVLTVGATDDLGTADVADDVVAAYSSRGAPGSSKPDIVAPGTHLVSLRAVGSTTDVLGTLLDGTYRQGSGTSMSTAVVSGVVALLRQAEPSWTPDQVKAALRESARPVAQGDPSSVGQGLLDASAALSVPPSTEAQPRTVRNGGRTPDEARTGDDWTGDDWTGDDWTGDDWTGVDAADSSGR